MKSSNLILSLSIIILIVSASPAHSQCQPIYIFTGEAEQDFLAQVASAGDVNKDGFDDLIIGADFNDAGGINAGRAYVYSGLDSSLLYTFTGEAADDRLGRSVASAGDVNQDGYDDLIVGAPQNDAGGSNAGRAYVFSGQTGETLYVFTGEAAGDNFGISVASAGDVDNDGIDDLIVGAWLNAAGGFDAGRAYVFSGQTGETIHVFTGEAATDWFGHSAASAGDVNNDGFDDLIVGALSRFSTGRAYVFSGQSGNTIHVFTGEATEDWFGHTVASAGDVDKDGYDDVIINAPRNDAGGTDAGRAYVFSGQTAETLHVFTGEAAGDWFGLSVASAGDVNNDDFDDLIVGAYRNDAGGTDAGRAYVFSGQSGDTLHVFTGEAAGDLFTVVASAGDVNNDGFDDLIVGAFENSVGGFHAGRVYVFSGKGCLCADANGDSQVNVGDVAYLIDYYFYSGTSPVSLVASDLNCDGSVNIADITYLAAYINGIGAAPCCQQ